MVKFVVLCPRSVWSAQTHCPQRAGVVAPVVAHKMPFLALDSALWEKLKKTFEEGSEEDKLKEVDHIYKTSLQDFCWEYRVGFNAADETDEQFRLRMAKWWKPDLVKRVVEEFQTWMKARWAQECHGSAVASEEESHKVLLGEATVAGLTGPFHLPMVGEPHHNARLSVVHGVGFWVSYHPDYEWAGARIKLARSLGNPSGWYPNPWHKPAC